MVEAGKRVRTEAERSVSVVIPTLPALDLDATAAFYARIGFTVRARYEDYLILVRDWIELHFFHDAKLDPLSTASGCYLRTPEALRLHADFAEADLPGEGTPRLTSPSETHYGMTEFALIDPNGNLMRIGRVRE